MKTITFTTEIHAPIEKVWEALWNEDAYTEWTKHFVPGSYYESDWQIGGKTLFLGPDGNGMFATITKLEKPYEVIFLHKGEIWDGVEKESFAQGAFEKYLLTESNGSTTLTVSVDVDEQYEDHMDEGFSKGLDEVKRIAENDTA
ncbi:MAG: SRPBCC domain-containing protein [Proteiniphilum sp.]|mgnify:CR=1 FL=1|nr:SRPBCC domain-containing protein [Proteiniphilum sp.]